MSKLLLVLLFLSFSSLVSSAQYYYPEITSYSIMGAPLNGVKIKTNLPHTNSVQMPTVIIKGYNYNTGEPIALDIVWYIYNGNFTRYGVSSSGAYTPEIKLAIENNKVVIYLNDRQYYQRFFVSAFAKMREQPSWFTGWTIADEPLNGTHVVTVPYRNQMKGEVQLPQGVWKTDGSVGIGTTNTRSDKLAVNGDIRARAVKVEVANWPDYVFDQGYELPTLTEVAHFITENGHLPGIPSKSEVETNGLSLGTINAQLLKKIEELMLYLIQQQKETSQLKEAVGSLSEENKVLKEELRQTKTHYEKTLHTTPIH